MYPQAKVLRANVWSPCCLQELVVFPVEGAVSAGSSEWAGSTGTARLPHTRGE